MSTLIKFPDVLGLRSRLQWLYHCPCLQSSDPEMTLCSPHLRHVSMVLGV